VRLLAATAMLALALTAPAAALASDEVRVEPEGGEPVTLTSSGLGDPDVRERSYRVDDGAGGERHVTITGHSLDRVLARANVDPYRFGSLEVASADGSFVLDRDEVVDTSGFPDGPPVFYLENGSVRFVEPAREGGAPGRIGGPGPVTVSLSKASRLQVTPSASTRRTKPRKPVTFTATVAGARPGEQVTVRWYFDDGSSARGRQVTHRFRRPGSYDVVVGVTSPDDERGADASVSVRVGKPPDGPDRKGGGTNDDANAPDSGAGAGTTGAGSAATPGGGESSRAGGASPRRGEQAPSRPPETAAPTPGDEPVPESGGSSSVQGIELAGLSALATQAGRDAVRAAARRGRELEAKRPDPGILPGVWWALGASALLAAGGWREARGASRRYGPTKAADRWIWF